MPIYKTVPFRYTPTGVRLKAAVPKSKLKSASCHECGHVWTDEEINSTSTYSQISRHMVDMHGYKEVGGQVFKSTVCVACSKPGLYKIGSVAYCKAHVHLGKSRLSWRVGVIDEQMKARNNTAGGEI